jgi:hypothetical protein
LFTSSSQVRRSAIINIPISLNNFKSSNQRRIYPFSLWEKAGMRAAAVFALTSVLSQRGGSNIKITRAKTPPEDGSAFG